ncbi:RNA polymerase sigma factor [Sphingobacterium paucimobilis]|uniref:RNA polymerase sigma factor n=1 Tax=Sphingobacterium paucimobilis HER1398 TaxID=1346330 RepID=U2HT92_9SPHI|nr:RNA polymerase sigma-70 factor [Sphingobacterium paucimobilis]ERJ58717.1 hypothetical protein M472_08045 [Sphingobacterium paucimobilis HER1398]
MDETNLVSLVSRFSKGDEKAFLHVFNLYYAKIHSFLLKYVHSNDLAEDLTQEVFIKVWEQREKLIDVKYFKSYLYSIAKNHTLNVLEKASRSRLVMGEIVDAYLEGSNTTEENIWSKEYLHCLNLAIERLPERSREIFRLCREQKKTYEEVAALIGISKNAVKNHMVFSMKQLRQTVERQLGISLSILITVFFH